MVGNGGMASYRVRFPDSRNSQFMITLEEISKNWTRRAAAIGLTAGQLCAAAGVNQSAVSMWKGAGYDRDVAFAHALVRDFGAAWVGEHFNALSDDGKRITAIRIYIAVECKLQHLERQKSPAHV